MAWDVTFTAAQAAQKRRNWRTLDGLAFTAAQAAQKSSMLPVL